MIARSQSAEARSDDRGSAVLQTDGVEVCETPPLSQLKMMKRAMAKERDAVVSKIAGDDDREQSSISTLSDDADLETRMATTHEQLGRASSKKRASGKDEEYEEQERTVNVPQEKRKGRKHARHA